MLRLKVPRFPIRYGYVHIFENGIRRESTPLRKDKKADNPYASHRNENKSVSTFLPEIPGCKKLVWQVHRH